MCECRETCRQFSAPPAGPLAELRLSSPRGQWPSRGTGGCTRTALATGRLRPLEERGGDARASRPTFRKSHTGRPAVGTTARAGPLLPLVRDRGSTLRVAWLHGHLSATQVYGNLPTLSPCPCGARECCCCCCGGQSAGPYPALSRPCRRSAAPSAIEPRRLGVGPHPHRSADLALRTVDGRPLASVIRVAHS